MTFQPSVLCPIDFSDSSRGALRYAAAITVHFGARLTLLVVNDPLLQEADEIAGVTLERDRKVIREHRRRLEEGHAGLGQRFDLVLGDPQRTQALEERLVLHERHIEHPQRFGLLAR